MSAIMLATTIAVPVTRKKPITAFGSGIFSASLKYLPMPDQPKTVSVMIAPPISAADVERDRSW